MRVKRLRMQSFRGIGDLTLEFPTDEPTVFIGINGVGKSSILDCIAILFSPYIDLIRLRDKIDLDDFTEIQIGGNSFQWGAWDIIKLLYKNNTLGTREVNTLISRFFSNEDIQNSKIESNVEITALLDINPEINWALTSKKPLINTTEVYTSVLLGILNQCRAIFENNIPLVIYYPSNRAILDIPLDISDQFPFEQLDAYKSAVAGVQINFNRFFQWFRALEDLENEERRDDPAYRDRRIEAVRRAIYSLVPDFSKLRVRRSPLRMTVEKKGQEFSLNQLSDGEKCLLAPFIRELAHFPPGDAIAGAGGVCNELLHFWGGFGGFDKCPFAEVVDRSGIEMSFFEESVGTVGEFDECVGLTFTNFPVFQPVEKAGAAPVSAFFLPISDRAQNSSAPNVGLQVEAIAHLPRIIKLLLKIEIGNLLIFWIRQLKSQIGDAGEGIGKIVGRLERLNHWRKADNSWFIIPPLVKPARGEPVNCQPLAAGKQSHH